MKVNNKQPTYFLVGAGLLSLAIAMGIGRFAYTPLLPLMQKTEGFTAVLAGNIASLNYIGYLIGAITAGVAGKRNTRRLFIFLILSILTTLLMGLTSNSIMWMVLRFLSGIASGIIFVFASSIVIDEISKRGLGRLAGFLYGGVGLGIFLSGIVVAYLPTSAEWRWGWLMLGGIGLAFFLLIIKGFKGVNGEVNMPLGTASSQSFSENKTTLRRLYISYGCEGFGYIICATFLISMITEAQFFSGPPAFIWAAVGLAAIPSCVIWAKLGTVLTNLVALRIAYIMQILGVLLPVIVKNDWTAFIGAFLFGATFMGITTLTISIGKELVMGNSTKVISGLTAIYGVGQILGPAISGGVAYVYQGYEGAFLLSAFVLVIALAILPSTSLKEEKQIAVREH